MDLLLLRRATHLQERMDDPNCDLATLFNTYRQFETVNRLFSQWKEIYLRFIKPILKTSHRTCTLLDVGFGGADIPLSLLRWAQRDGYRLRITCIDPDERAMEFARRQTWPPDMTFAKASLEEIAAKKERFDIVTSNHLVHHFSDQQLRELLFHAAKLARGIALFNDIWRSPFAFAGFGLLTIPFFRRSFVVTDGLTSIRRSYTPKQLQSVVPRDWVVQKLPRCRLLLVHRKMPQELQSSCRALSGKGKSLGSSVDRALAGLGFRKALNPK